MPMSEISISSDAVPSSWGASWSDDDLPTAERLIGDPRPRCGISHRPAANLPGMVEGDPAAPPTVLPGQLWLIEMAANEKTRSALEIAAITTANVVIYDRALAPVVAQYLRLGGYAEPHSTNRAGPDRTLARCLQFARDGWSVAWLVEPGSLRSGRADEVRELSARLTAANPSAMCSMFRLADPDTRGCRGSAERGAPAGLVASHRRTARLGIVVDAGLGGAAPRISVASSNGLAG
jgi:hypothetical protein